MKYVIVLADGMADEPIKELDNRTPLEFADTPSMDLLASEGQMGLVRTVPQQMAPGSDVANLSILGYDPLYEYSGRSPLEALSVGAQMFDNDVIYRCNFVTLSEEEPYEKKRILDHSSSEISTKDSAVLMQAINDAFLSEKYTFFTGTSYRNLFIWHHGVSIEFAPPHDHLGERIEPYLPSHPLFRNLMEASYKILDCHPLNIERKKNGLNKANSLWFWGAGTKPQLQSFYNKTGLHGTMISAVDLLKGIAVGAQMDVAHIHGATGSLHTNYVGKAQAALDALLKHNKDLVYVHVEAPDEMGHQGNVQHKVQSIEYIDKKIIEPIKQQLDISGEEYRMLVLPDHPTPIRLRTHTKDPVPFLLYDSTKRQKKISRFSEREAADTGFYIETGHRLMDYLIGGKHYE